MAGGSTTAWADRDPDKAIYCPVNDGSYDYVKDAIDAIKDNAATELEIQIWGTRPKLGSVANSRVDVPSGKTLSIVPMVDGIILTAGSHNRGNIWFLNAQDNATFNIGSAEHAMTIEGYGFNDNNVQLNAVCANEKKGVMNITNVTFQKFRFGAENGKYGYIYANKVAGTSSTEGYVTMTDVTITNSYTANAAFINSINTNSDAICLKGKFTINHKDDYNEPVFYLKGRIKLGDKSSNSIYSNFTAPNLISIKWDGVTTIGTNVLVKVPEAQATGVFDLADEDYGLVRSGSGGDMKLTQAYMLPVSEYEAATLVLPFESTIPSGTSCYTLTYTAGGAKVTAASVETTLGANTPVLVNAAEGSYKFVSTATSGDLATGSSAQSNGALTGVYETTNVPMDSYILYADEAHEIGFYQVTEEGANTVAANRCYLTATSGARLLFIDYGNEAASIDGVNHETITNNRYYNLSGQRVVQPAKGLYIVNGKKIIIK